MRSSSELWNILEPEMGEFEGEERSSSNLASPSSREVIHVGCSSFEMVAVQFFINLDNLTSN